MSALHGKNTTVYLGAVNLSPYMTSADMAADVDVADTTTFGSSWKTGITGTGSGSVNVAGYYDPAETSIRTLMMTGLPGVLTYSPGAGTAVGDPARLVSALSASLAESSPVGGVVAFTGGFTADAVVGFGAVLHPMAEDTNTTVGASRNDGAASATGWVAHLHVTAVDGGTWVVKLEDSADNSSWSDVTGGAFTSTGAATSQRLLSAAADTALRRYVRYTATRTGGAVGNGITFLLAYARNR